MEKENNLRQRQTDAVISSLWRNWAIAFGAITLPLLISLWVPKVWVSILTLFEAWALTSLIKSDRWGLSGYCSMILKIAARVMLFTALVMLFIVVLCTDWLVPTVIHLELYNTEIPFVTCLIVFPITLLFCIIWLFTGLGDGHCRECQRRNGYYAGDDIAATLYFRETRYQVTVLAWIAGVCGAVEYWYYFFRFINANLNDPDRFFFNYIPLAVYLLSLVVMYGRYTSMRVLYNALDAANPKRRNRTVVRYLVFYGDELLVREGHDHLLDTPAEAVIELTKSIGDQQARLLFEEMSGCSEFRMRYCFTNAGFATGSTLIHYAVFLDSKDQVTFGDTDRWLNPYMIDQALATNSIAPVLANEIFRIHTITMAWKTYDRNGHRLYPIRHYRPTFRFSDLPDWNVDYDDQSWFDVANNNEDRKFYRLRSLFNHLTGAFRSKPSAR